MGEKSAASKNNDCYFYYYSSCSKGAACPFRHEPSALRNETMCIYWMQGNCNKANCIFRHMEITKKRDRIACWFESQPGGCKKPHCPFQHQNILDHPREEDIKKKPDLILPVKTEEEKKEVEKPSVTDVSVESERQVILPQALLDPAIVARQPQFSDPIIVQLQDGESDSESVSGSPQKRIDPCPRLSAQMEWELRRLRQIQEHEANLIGYTFEEDQDDQSEGKVSKNEEKAEDPEEYVVEEVVEIEDENDAAHRRLFHQAGGHRPHLAVSMLQEPAAEEDLRHSLLKHRTSPKRGEVRVRNKAPISARLGGVAGRTLADTLGTTGSLRRIHVKRHNSRGDTAENVNVKSISHRIGESKSVVRRLGGRLGKDPAGASTPEEGPSLTEKALVGRVGMKRSHQPDMSVDSKTPKSFPDTSIKKRISRNTPEKTDPVELDFTIKSLADIRAEKRKKSPTKKVQKSGVKNGTNSLPFEVKEVASHKDDGEVRVLTLAEIRASKQQAVTTSSSSTTQQKRPPSPITFTQHSSKKFKSASKGRSFPVSTNPTSNSSPKQDSLEHKIIFSTRKISINRSPVKASECVSQPSHQEESPMKAVSHQEPPPRAVNKRTHHDVPPTGGVNKCTHHDVPPTGGVNKCTHQDVPPTRTVNKRTHQDVPPTGAVNKRTHQDVTPTRAANQPSHQDVPPTRAANQPSHQELLPTIAVNQLTRQDVPPTRAVNQPSHQDVPPTRAVNQPSHQDVPPTRAVNQPSHQDIPPTIAVNQLSHQDVPPTGAVNQPTHQDVPPARVVNQPSHQDVPPTRGVNQPSNQDVAPTRAANHPSHQDIPPTTAVNQPSHQEVPPTRAVNQPTQDVPPTRAVNQPSHQDVPPTRAVNEPSDQEPPTSTVSQPSDQEPPTTAVNQASHQEEPPTGAVNQPSHQDVSPIKAVQAKGSATKSFHSHSEKVHDKSLGNSEKVDIDVTNSAVSVVVLSNKLTPATNAKLNSSCNREPLNRIDSLLDEEEALLLEGDMLELEDDDVDEDDLLL